MVNETAFESIKIRKLILWMVVFFIIMCLLYVITRNLLADAEWDVIVGFLFYIFLGWWIVRNFNRVHLNYEKFMGHIPLYFH